MNARTIQLILALAVAATSLVAAPAFAQEGAGEEPTNEDIAEAAEAGEVDENVFADGPIVRRKLLYRSTRFEVAPFVGFTLNDGFRRNMLAGANFGYHLTNEFGIGGTFSYGVLQFDTSLSDNITATLQSNSQTDTLNQVSYSYIQFAADLGLSYVPMYGKFTLFGSATINWDLHMVGGVVLVSEKVEAAVDGGTVDPVLEGIRPGGLLQVGVRLFVSDMVSINIDAKNMLYSRSEISGGPQVSPDPEFSNTVLFTAGVGIFLPGEVKVSR